MVFDVSDLIVRLRWERTLLAGTLPPRTLAGVSLMGQPPVFLAAGDRFNIDIESIRRLTNPVEAA
jgi:2-keto-4-pentenoate hydratase/2-oxohepta-3-ene-1,7-dioic acid hydratase in catechol pathway